MRQLSSAARRSTTESNRPPGRTTDQMVGDVLSEIASTLWPKNTAPHLAAEIGCTVRAAERYLGGQRDWPSDAVAVIVGEILSRHKMRNVRVVARTQ